MVAKMISNNVNRGLRVAILFMDLFFFGFLAIQKTKSETPKRDVNCVMFGIYTQYSNHILE